MDKQEAAGLLILVVLGIMALLAMALLVLAIAYAVDVLT